MKAGIDFPLGNFTYTTWFGAGNGSWMQLPGRRVNKNSVISPSLFSSMMVNPVSSTGLEINSLICGVGLLLAGRMDVSVSHKAGEADAV